jgi:hypothetical protein
MTIADYVATEKGYWEEEAMREETRAWHTMLALSPYQGKGKKPEVADFMMPWAANYLGYRFDTTNREKQVVDNYKKIIEAFKITKDV